MGAWFELWSACGLMVHRQSNQALEYRVLSRCEDDAKFCREN